MKLIYRLKASILALFKGDNSCLSIFVLLSTIFGILFALMIPALWGYDEAAHFNRALEVSRGTFVPQINVDGRFGDNLEKSIVEYEIYLNGDLTDNNPTDTFLRRQDISDKDKYEELVKKSIEGEKVPTVLTATYSPIAYIGPVIGLRICGSLDCNLSTTVIVGRLFGLTSYIFIVSLAIFIIRKYKFKWVIAVASLLPVALTQGATISADAYTNAISILLTAIIFRSILEKNISNRLLTLAMICSLILPLIKLNNLGLSLLILLIPLNNFSRLYSLVLRIATLASAVLLSFGWITMTSVLERAQNSPRMDGQAVNPSSQISFVLNNIPDFIIILCRTIIENGHWYVSGIFGAIGWNMAPIPYIIVILSIWTLVLTIIFCKDEILRIDKLKKIIILVIISIYSLITSVALYVSYNVTGNLLVEGLQGRYFYPILIPILAIFTVLPIKFINVQRVWSVPILFATSITLILFISLVTYLMVIY